MITSISIGQEPHPQALEMLSWAPLRALGVPVERRSLVEPRSVLELGDLESGSGVAASESGHFEWREWSRGSFRTEMETNDVRAVQLKILIAMLWPGRKVLSFGRTPGVDVSADDEFLVFRWGESSWARFPGGGRKFGSAFSLYQLLSVSDEDLVASVMSDDGAPVFGPTETVIQARRESGASPAFHSLDTWLAWVESRSS